MPSESNGAQLDADTNTAGSKQGAVSTRLLRGTRAKAAPQPETEAKSEEEGEQEGAKIKVEAVQEKSPYSESMRTRKGALKKDSSPDVGNAANSTNTSKATSDPVLEKFLDPNRPYKCNACLESFPSKSALGVHYSSTSHLQRMRMGSVKQGEESDAASSSSSSVASQPTLPRPFISSKPYQCAVCRVSYNHAFTLESHMKSVLHQTRSRNAVNTISGNSDKKVTVHSGNITTATSAANTANPAAGSVVNASQCGSASTDANGIQGSLNSSSGATKDTEQSQPQTVPSTCPPSAPALSLLSSPVASAQAVSAFLTLLTSSPHSVAPPLFAANPGAAPGAPTPQLELIAQQQLLLPLFLNGLQTQNQSSSLETPNAVLTQSVPLLGLSAAQQALLAQRLSTIQNQSTGSLLGLSTSLQGITGQNEREEPRDVEEKLNKDTEERGENGQGKVVVKEERVSMNPKFEADSEVLEKITIKNENEGENMGKHFSKPDGTSKSEQNMEGESNAEPTDKDTTVGSDITEQLEIKEDAFNKTEEIQNDSEPFRDAMHHDSPGIHITTFSPCNNDTFCPGNVDPCCPHKSPSPNLDKLLNCISADLKHSSLIPLNAVQPLTASRISNLKSPNSKLVPPVLSEFQSQVLWAFLESRSETDAASPLREDCEALGKEVGLDEEAVRRWLREARRTRDRQKNSLGKAQFEELNKAVDQEEEVEEEGVLTIVETEEGESPTTSSHAIDLSHGGGRGRGKEQGRESPGESCLTSDSDNDGLYTSFIVTDEESQNSSVREELGSPAREETLRDEKESRGGGKVLRSSTVFLSDAEDTEEDEDGTNQKVKKRKRRREAEEMEVKAVRLDPDVDLELEAQADPPPLSASVEQQAFPSIASGSNLQALHLSHSLTPFATQFLNPYVLSLQPSAVGLGMVEGDGDRERGRGPTFTHPPTITRCSAPFLDSLKAPPLASHMSPARSISNGGICESALDLSIGKKPSSTTPCSSSSAGSKAVHLQRDHALDGLGLAPTTPGAGGLIVVRVKPDSAVAIPTTNSSVNSNNSRTSTVYIRAAERVNASMMEKERGKQQDRETEIEKQQKHPKGRRFRDMRRSRTIIQTEQLDVLYGCYFKDPNPGKHEFERISEWVHLPKKVVQIWFQNMRARERKGEVRFISDGTLAAVGKPLIKFTWPLTLPIFSSSPSPNTSGLSSSGIAKVSAGAGPVTAPQNTRAEKEKGKEKEESNSKESVASPSLPQSVVPKMPKPKSETQNQVTVAKPASKAVAAAPAIPIVVMKTRSSPSSNSSQKRKRGKEDEGEEGKTDEEEEDHREKKMGPGSSNRMVPKIPSALAIKPPPSESHKQNGLNDWSSKSTFKMTTLSREQLSLSSGRTSVTTTAAPSTPTNASTTPKSSPGEGSYVLHSTPRRPRTHLTSLQVSIMQSCYETCPHPNALECETVGTELGLPLKVVQIWFQNTRAKEKRWRLQLQKQSPSTESSKKVDTSSGSFLLYNALRANRPILPKPVQLTVLEPSAPPGLGQPAGRETLRGRCDACAVEFESRAAGRTHVFSPRHLATLRSTNFGQPPSLVNKGSGTGSSLVSGVAVQSSPNPASTTS
ncbi:zinc finger homeobox protein 4-like isoform X2 [Brienomyrus brachyistius]|nr:zinc finger homeobox protein 4-like isoform X2 [Brienomyrus brachyistius]XP_048866106.1 zinc finger homeobox protein 4-like isoform X2 [Brienomyrus brachyistius]